MSQISLKKSRSPNFTSDELDVLSSEVIGKNRLLSAKLGGFCTAAAKTRAWQDIAAAVSLASGYARSVTEVKKKWVSMRSLAKGKAGTLNRERAMTGGGLGEGEELSELEERIVGSLGKEVVFGLAGGFDTTGGEHYNKETSFIDKINLTCDK
jgi:Myb/SANT-like DNA-binding domain